MLLASCRLSTLAQAVGRSMSIEAMWYSSYVDGDPPPCWRLSRRPIEQQWNAAIDLAIAFARGEAGFRQTSIAKTREVMWYWPGDVIRQGKVIGQTDWCYVPWRVMRRVSAVREAATITACRANSGQCSGDDIIRTLLRWKRSGVWRRHARTIHPKCGIQSSYLQTFGGEKKRRGRPKKTKIGEEETTAHAAAAC